jgi:hypothetical protein
MRAEMTEKQWWYDVDTNVAGSEFVPQELIGYQRCIDADGEPDLETIAKLRDYLEGSTVNAIARVFGYGVRLSAPGYMDCTSWSVYANKREAERAARELESDGD